MKLMFASDIHGSYYYAQKTVEAYREEKAEKLIFLHDVDLMAVGVGDGVL